MSDREHAAALVDAIEGLEDVCLGPSDIEIVVKALVAFATTASVSTASEPEAA